MKNARPFNEKELKALLSRLKDTAGEYPAALASGRRAAYLEQTAGLKIAIGSNALYGTILHGMKATSSLLTKAVLLPSIGITVAGTVLLVGISQGWIQFGGDRRPENTSIPPLVETFTPSPTPTLTSTPTPTITPSKTPEPNPGLHLGWTPTPPGHRDGNP